MCLKPISLCLWIAAVVAVGAHVAHYVGTPGPATRAPSTALASTVTLYLHPKCVCSRASVQEFRRLLPALAGHRIRVIYHDQGKGMAWAQSELWTAFEDVPGVERVLDSGGRQTRADGVRTSGHVLAYGPDQRLLFSGGITASRGHEGPSPGGELLKKLSPGARQPAATPTFGCDFDKTPPKETPR